MRLNNSHGLDDKMNKNNNNTETKIQLSKKQRIFNQIIHNSVMFGVYTLNI